MNRFLIVFLSFFSGIANAQQFINKGMIEFEVRVNNHRAVEGTFWGEATKNQLPQFSTSWYHYTFHDNKAVYKLDRHDEKTKTPYLNPNADDEVWYSDYESGSSIIKKFVLDANYIMKDSLRQIEWKLSPTETREIAGFLCRKASAIIFDSVYVFAFYTDEINISGGPMSLHGLPGMILGVTIPRLFTSWIATKLELNGVNTKIIEVPQKGKSKSANELRQSVEKATKDWGSYGQQAVWKYFL